MGVVAGLDGDDNGPTSVRGTLMDYDEVQLAGDGELITRSPYVTWRPEDTRVISYVIMHPNEWPLGRELRPGWRSAPNARTARAEVKRDHGVILEENAAGDNVFFRVNKERK
jgi:hypothetical protein